MQMSQEGINVLIKKFEGCKLTAYRCPAGKCTIGYGHTSAAGKPLVNDGMQITQKEADDILRMDLIQYETDVINMVQQPLTQYQFDALVDFVYNAGAENFRTSTLLKKVNAAKFDEVPAELMKWNKGGKKVLAGLVHRRQDEGTWFMSGAVHSRPAMDGQEHRAVPDAVPVPSMVTSKQGNAAIITASLGGLGAMKQVAAQAQDASDTANQIVGLLSNTNFLIMVAVIGLGGAIWYFRKQHMEEHDV